MEELAIVSNEALRGMRAEIERAAADQRKAERLATEERMLSRLAKEEEARAQREIVDAAARCKRELDEAGAKKTKLEKLREAIASGKLLASVEKRLAASKEGIEALGVKLAAADAKVAELPPGVAEAFKKPAAVWPSQDPNNYDDYNNDDDNDRNYTSHHGDYTACDKECGYCGSCDY